MMQQSNQTLLAQNGAAMGSLYSPLADKEALPATAKGIAFGLVVWAASYLGLLPLIGLSESGHREPGRRNLMMVAAHVVWGAATALLFRCEHQG